MDKPTLRKEFRARRRSVQGPDRVADAALDRLVGIPEFANAGRLLVYVEVRSELATRERIAAWIDAGRDVAVPWCDGATLRACRLRSLDELRPGRFDIPEPLAEIRELAGRVVEPEDIDLFVVPGLAFDECGGRLGYGGGFFDRLLAGRRPGSCIVGLAFDAQLQLGEPLPREPHDVRVDVVVTESRTLRV